MRLMLRGGADVDLARADGATPLFKACHKGHEEVVKEILRFKPRLDTLQVFQLVYNFLSYLLPFQNGFTDEKRGPNRTPIRAH